MQNMFSSMEMCLEYGGVGCVCVLRECVCHHYYNWNLLYIHKLLHFANHFVPHLFLFLVITLLLNVNIKNSGNYILF